MKHIAPLLMKLVMCFLILFVVAGLFYGWSLSAIIWTSLILTIASYLIGDLWILPTTANVMAVLADFMLSIVVIWVFGNLFLDKPVSLIREPLISSLVIMASEWLFHKYMMPRLENRSNNREGSHA